MTDSQEFPVRGYARHRHEHRGEVVIHGEYADGTTVERKAKPSLGGGSVSRKVLRNVSGARIERTPQRRGASGRSTSFMRPPGCGSVRYQDPNQKHVPRVYRGEAT